MPATEYVLKRSNINSSVDSFGRVVLRGVKYFSLEKTFDCGQCFRFERVSDGEYDERIRGIAFGRLVEFARKGEEYYIIGSSLDEYKSIWRHFLGLDINYPKMRERILADTGAYPSVSSAEECSCGIRILAQDPFETLISFIISQNNNIPRIKGIIERLCREAGEKRTGFDGTEYYSFPTPEAILSRGGEMLKDIGTGFRAKYITDACERVLYRRIDFDYLRDCEDTAECVRHLCEIYGVGVKVASCVLLFSFEKFDAYPEDVWIKKVHAKYFAQGFDPSLLGSYRGLVQQWMFFYERYLGGGE